MSTDQHTPSDEDVRESFVRGETTGGEDAVWWDDLVPGAQAEYDRWLAAHDARVRRDVAREALDGYAKTLDDLTAPAPHLEADRVRHYRDTHYPTTEETP